MKKVSVIIPCYNAESFIDRCIISLVRQTIGLESLELIFVNDASQDGTLEKLKLWESRYPNSIMVIDCAENHRTGGARNIGMRHATAEYIGFVDNDDMVEPDMYERLYDAAMEYDCDVVASLYERVSEDGIRYDVVHMPEGIREIPVDCSCRPEGVAGLPGEIWNKIFRRDIIFDHDIFFLENCHYAENYWAVILKYYIKRYYVVDKIMYHHIVNSNSILMSKDSSVHKDRLDVEIKTLEEISRRGLDDIHSEELEYQFTRKYYINTLHRFCYIGTDLDYDLLRKMQQEMLRRYPGYRKNQKIRDYMNDNAFSFLLGTLEMDLSQEDWDRIAEAYRNEEYDILIYMSEIKALQWGCGIYEEFLQFGLSISEMMLKYGMSVISEPGKQRNHWGEFLQDYRQLWDMFVDNDRQIQSLIQSKKLRKAFVSYNENSVQQIWADLEDTVDMERMLCVMDAMIQQLQRIRTHYANILGESQVSIK
ncbi:MAG: glycosyltransferase [Lachnospiraceae bacterium]|nr:glycosyltransferase [Lachnospiraceae bacterium]